MTEEEVFLAALDLADPDERTAYLEQACHGDAALRRQVEELLAAHFKEGGFLDEPIGAQMGAGYTPPGMDPLVTRIANRVRAGDGDEASAPEEDAPDLSFLQPPTDPGALGRIGHYEVLEVLGRGGFGTVLRARDEVLQRVVALKVLAPVLAATSPARKRFLREARAFAQVRHENVVQIYAVEELPLPYLVMEFIPGETLQQRLDRTGPLEAPEIVRLGHQIAEGLAAAHATGLIHRDVTPGNVLIEAGPKGRVKITDFGLARAADDASLTRSGMLAGTPMYMAPEQANGEALDHRADLFGLGSVLYTLTTGRPPFRAATALAVLKRVSEDTPRPIRDVIPEAPQWLADVIAKLHAKKPQDRFPSAREVADLLAECGAQLGANAWVTAPARALGNKPATGRRKWIAVALVLPVLALALTEGTGATHWLRPRTPVPDPAPSAGSLDDKGAPVPPRALRDGAPNHTNALEMKFNRIPAGTFTMGSPAEAIDRLVGAIDDEGYKRMLRAEGPQHPVELTRPFYMGTTEVTVGQFRRFVEANPGYAADERWKQPGFPQTDEHPVVYVSWQNAVDFCTWLSEQEGQKYRLPTEAEWEYCCRAGTRYAFGDDEAQLGHYAWFDTGVEGARAVGGKRPNTWGLYDMHGNVWEWCQDWYDPNYYPISPFKDPTGPSDGNQRVQRGGSWGYGSMVCRSVFRSHSPPAHANAQRGFRVLLVAE